MGASVVRLGEDKLVFVIPDKSLCTALEVVQSC